MISRLQSRILPRLIHLQNPQRFFNDEGCEHELFYLKNNKLNIDERDGFITPEIPKISNIGSPSFRSESNFIVDENGYVNVYTDGACISNGMANPKAGIGVWFGDHHSLNVSQPIVGRSTCNVAEIMAVTEAARQAKKAGVKKLKINTDSQFLIKCVTEWMKKWKIGGWKTAKKKPVINKEELIELESALSSLEVTWAHVSSHSGIHGNEMAHLLAKEGICKIKEEISS
ncbi:ribonuclease H1-like [Belonocnema kinseyi]|uniref:ribonuclease H1-like n=1 Tax=Belonocnema kinseyi TaxID=2817044 RepID=UPI00143DEA21|nr:ribonuclease H1-like [Belonocnema kinseyi]